MMHGNNAPVGDKCGRKQAIFQITGMMCESCVSRVESAIKGLSGVSAAVASLTDRKATVTYDPLEVSAADLVAAIKGAGYGVVSEKVTLPVSGMMCANCVRHIEEALRGLGGIYSASASLEHKRVTIKYNPAQINLDDIKHTIEATGYKVL